MKESLAQELEELFRLARDAATRAYNPYSHFSVGCAIRTASGRTYLGCNIENASFGVTLCAERVAGSQAIFHRDRDWRSIVVVSPQSVSCCGICRQFLHEFAPDAMVWTGYLDPAKPISGPVKISDLLPSGMKLEM
jgi:cytidine deaminase